MRGKVMFTREAAQRNVILTEPPPCRNNYTACQEIGNVTRQYSQLMVKGNWRLYNNRGHIYAQGAEQGPFKNPMAAIDGDGSPLSYLQAASCYHSLMEYSRRRSLISEEAILDDAWVRNLDLLGNWRFGVPVRSLNPVFFYDSLLHPVVIYFSHHYSEHELIYKNIHRFDLEGYTLKFQQRVWDAYGEPNECSNN